MSDAPAPDPRFGPHSTPAVRREWVEARFASGQPTRAIQREGAALFALSKSTIRHDLAEVRRRLASAFTDETPDSVRARSEAILLDALAVAKADSDVPGMALIAQRLAEIHGAYKREVSLDVRVRGIGDLLDFAAREAPDAEGVQRGKRSGGA